MKPSTGEIKQKYIPIWHREVKKLLPTLPDNLVVSFDNRYLIPLTGTGGFAAAANKIILAYDPQHPSTAAAQLHQLRASFFHECYHVVQGWVGDISFSPIEEAVLEGAATVFEKQRAGTKPPWGDYPKRSTVLQWLKQVKALPLNFDRQKWKYQNDDDSSYIIYRLGTFIVDEALIKNPRITIEDLATTPPSEILTYSTWQ